MRKLMKPTDLPEDVFLESISNYQNEEFKEKLSSYINEIKRASEIYEEKAKQTQLHTIITQEANNGPVNKLEMINVYNDKFAKKGQPGRRFYDKIIASTKFKRCPLCGQRQVSTLDHHLPKTKYPALAVTPANLVPACFDCNKLKTASTPSIAEEETLHPYFDDIDNEIWLHAEIIEEVPLAFNFLVKKHEDWDDIKMMRVKNHFNTFQLGELYSLYAAEELSLRLFSLNRIHEEYGSRGVREQLLDFTISSEQVYLNSWQAAMYGSLAVSDWFCSEGIHMKS